jgi:hypothetical protein
MENELNIYFSKEKVQVMNKCSTPLATKHTNQNYTEISSHLSQNVNHQKHKQQ